MFEWISQNIGTIVAALFVSAVAAGAVILLVRDKKKGKHSCGCGCAHCPMSGKCHGSGNCCGSPAEAKKAGR